jgi:hypothetical protein
MSYTGLCGWMDGIFSGDGTVRALGTVKLNGTVSNINR